MANEKIIIENWTNESIEDLLEYISIAIKEKNPTCDRFIITFEKVRVSYLKNKKSDKWIISENRYKNKQ